MSLTRPTTEDQWLFWRTCRNAGIRREQAKREHWTAEEWAAWCKRARAAFGPSPRQLFGQIALVETMLEHGLDGDAIAAELERMDANREVIQRRQESEAAERMRKYKIAGHEAAVRAEVEKELVKAEARRLAADLTEQRGLAMPRPARKRLVGVGPDA